MIVCVCANVSERSLRNVIAEGATTAREIERRCGAGAGCGECRPLVRECLKQCKAEAQAAVSAVQASDLTPLLVPA